MGLNLVTDNYPVHAQYVMQLMEAVKGNGAYVGLAVAAQGTPDNTVQVSSGRFAQGGTILNSAGSASLSFTTAHASLPRIDLVEATTSISAPYVQVKAGTAAASPVAPTPDANSVVLAYVYVRATGAAPVIKDTDDSTNAYIIDARCYCPVKLGTATITTGNANVTVSDASVTANSVIFLQPSGLNKSTHLHTTTIANNTGALVGYSGGSLMLSGGGSITSNVTAAENWYADNISAGVSFRINVTTAVTANMTFNYMIVG